MLNNILDYENQSSDLSQSTWDLREKKNWFKPSSSFCTDRSNAVFLLQFFYVYSVSVVSYVAFVLSLFVPHLFFFWCLGMAVLPDSGISWVSTYIFAFTRFLCMRCCNTSKALLYRCKDSLQNLWEGLS